MSLPNDPQQFPPQTAQIISPFGLNLLRFINLVHQDSDYADEPLNKSCVGLLGDLCGIPGVAQVRPRADDTPGCDAEAADCLDSSQQPVCSKLSYCYILSRVQWLLAVQDHSLAPSAGSMAPCGRCVSFVCHLLTPAAAIDHFSCAAQHCTAWPIPWPLAHAIVRAIIPIAEPLFRKSQARQRTSSGSGSSWQTTVALSSARWHMRVRV